MPRPSYAVRLEAAGDVGEDRARVVEAGDVLIMVVADGAGGVRGSVRAAEAVVRGIDALIDERRALDDEGTWTDFLTETDSTVHRAASWGETTAIALAATDGWICGASVGDSEVWWANPDAFRQMTSGRCGRPLIGSGMAKPVAFRRDLRGGSLIVGTDGLFKFAPAWLICQTAVDHHPDDACRILLDRVRRQDGRLPDDVGLIVARLSS